MKLKFKLLALLISLSLTACGGSSGGSSGDSSSNSVADASGESSNDSGNTESSSSTATGNTSTSDVNNTTGNCTTVGRPQVGQIEVLKTITSFDSTDLYLSRKVNTLTDTFSSEEFSVRSGSENGEIVTKSTHSETYTIANNFRDVTQTIGITSSSIPDATGATSTQEIKIVSNYSPYLRNPVDRVCEGQTWINDYEVSDTTTFGNLLEPITSTRHNSTIHTIEAINISKTVPAGSFNTVQYKFEDGDSIITTWTDIATGMNIASEAKKSTGEIHTRSELISFTP